MCPCVAWCGAELVAVVVRKPVDASISSRDGAGGESASPRGASGDDPISEMRARAVAAM